MTIHVREISTDFTGLTAAAPNISELTHELDESAIGTSAGRSVVNIGVSGDDVTIEFDVALTVPGDTDELDAICAAHTGEAPEDGEDTDIIAAFAVSCEQRSISDAGWQTLGSITLPINQYADRYNVKVQARGQLETTDGDVDMRIQVRKQNGDNENLGNTTYDTAGAWSIEKYNKAPDRLPGGASEYRLQIRLGAATQCRIRGWVLTFLNK